jgi:hypothetical protein
LRVWLNAFIPKTVAGYTKLLATGVHGGKTAVPLPGVARFNPLNTLKNLDAGYLTDQRDFSEDMAASVRMQSRIDLMLSPHPKISAHEHRSSGTTEVDMDTGREIARGVADMKRCSFSPLVTRLATRRTGSYRTPLFGIPYHLEMPDAGPPTYEVRVRGQASDPLVSAAADIDYEGVFGVTIQEKPFRCFVSFDGYIDAFPAFECYAQLNGRTKCMFTSPPPPGNTVVNLPMNANRRVSGSAAFA